MCRKENNCFPLYIHIAVQITLRGNGPHVVGDASMTSLSTTVANKELKFVTMHANQPWDNDQVYHWSIFGISSLLTRKLYLYKYRRTSTLFTVQNSERGWRDNGQSHWTPPGSMGKWTLSLEGMCACVYILPHHALI